MRRYLLAWEFGGDLGHVRRQCAIARGLRARGHEVLLAFADLTSVAAEPLDGIDWVQAPRLPLPAQLDPSPLNASDILLNLGLGDPAALAGALAGWASLLRLWGPQALVADYAPVALIAARLASVRHRIGVGSGFGNMPPGDPMPALRPWIRVDAAALAERDARLVAAVRTAVERQSGKAWAPARAREIFEADSQLVCAWPELDPFGPRDGVDYVGPQAGGEALPEVRWAGVSRPRIFAYLKPRDARFRLLLEAFGRVGGESIVAAPGLTDAEAAALGSGGTRVVAHAVDLAAALEHADLCVGHGGAGMVAAACAQGVPLALLPMHLEQFLVARRAQAAGHAEVLAPEAGVPDLAAWLRALLGREDLRSAARAARPAAMRPAIDAAERIERIVGN